MGDTSTSYNESPFLQMLSHSGNEYEKTNQDIEPFVLEKESPFPTAYHSSEEGEFVDPDSEAFLDLMDSFYDEEFQEVLGEMANEAIDLYESQVMIQYEDMGQRKMAYQRMVLEHFNPFFQEFDNYMDHVIKKGDEYDQGKLSEGEMDLVFDEYHSKFDQEEPEFQQLFGWAKKAWRKVKSVAKKVKSIAKKGWNFVKKMGFGWVLRKIKNYFKKHLISFLKKIYRRLPSSVRRSVDRVANRIPSLKRHLRRLKRELPEEAYISMELDASLANLFLAPSQQEMDHLYEAYMSEDVEEEEGQNTIEQLDNARERFVHQLSELEEGEDAGPAIEEFIGTLKPVLKYAIKFIGEKRVKKTVARILKSLLKRFIGRRSARWLGKKLAYYGVRLITAEVSEEAQIEAANRAIALTTEETYRKVMSLSQEILEDESLLEAQVIRAFEEAAKVNLPDVLEEQVYRKRPKLRESKKHRARWCPKALGKKRRKYFRYKKLNKEIETELTPYILEEVKTHGGIPLATVLRDQLGLVSGSNIPAKVHLYEMMDGGRLHHLSRYEKHVPGLGSGASYARKQFHPLSSVAAGLLLGEPGLGCKCGKCLSHKGNLRGHRYYYLEIPGQNLQMFHSGLSGYSVRRPSTYHVKFDFLKNQLKLCIYLSESEAQMMALELRKQLTGYVLQDISSKLGRGLRNLFKYPTSVRILHHNVLPGDYSGVALNRIPPAVLESLKNAMLGWTERKLASYLHEGSEHFFNALKDPADGLSINLIFEDPPAWNLLDKYLSNKSLNWDPEIFQRTQIDVDVKIKPGYQYV